MQLAGARRLIAKRLAENDNSKNQIYLGSGFDALNILPFGTIRAEPGKNILKAPLTFRWLQATGHTEPAAGAQLILYPQYPEVRMSGFLKGTKSAPTDVMTRREAGRVLFLGVSSARDIVAAVARRGDPLAREFEMLVRNQGEKLFYEIGFGKEELDSRALLLHELGRIHKLGWINSKKLCGDGTIEECKAMHCGGYTLEAELGIRPNSKSIPDYLGWEVKQFAVTDFNRLGSTSPITLMTPQPTGGFYKASGLVPFLRKYGYPDRSGKLNRTNFGGTYRVGRPVRLTGLVLVLDGYNPATGKIDDPSRGITLLDARGNVAAVWGYAGLIEHWARKHEHAVYVPSVKRTEPRRQYQYGGKVLLCEGTDFFRFLDAMTSGTVYFDPAFKVVDGTGGNVSQKARSQFRVKLENLSSLYESAKFIEV